MKLFRQGKRHDGGSSSEGGGFTLIEVVLVLAIGGLIFLLAFLAFGQATKNRRDTQRRSDAGRVVSEIQNAAGDANGVAFSDAGSLGTFITSYLGGTPAPIATATGGEFTSNNIRYTVTYGSAAPTAATGPGVANMTVHDNAICVGNTIQVGTVAVPHNNSYAVAVGLEKGISCKDDK